MALVKGLHEDALGLSTLHLDAFCEQFWRPTNNGLVWVRFGSSLARFAALKLALMRASSGGSSREEAEADVEEAGGEEAEAEGEGAGGRKQRCRKRKQEGGSRGRSRGSRREEAEAEGEEAEAEGAGGRKQVTRSL